MKPRVFVASAQEHLDLAYAVQEGLDYDAEATVWTQGVFQLSRSTLAALLDQLDVSDFAIFIMAPSDTAVMRNDNRSTVRDNVVFELGLFTGRLGHERCFIIVPRGADELHLPTDLLGITPAEYDADRQDKNLVAALGAACNRIRKSIKRLGSHTQALEEIAAPEYEPEAVSLMDDENDCISLIESWMGSRSPTKNMAVLHFREIDHLLNLAPGSARLHTAKAAERFSYVVDRVGKDTIKLVKSNDDDIPF